MGWDAQADVVVVGSGLAGLCAALEAREAGAAVTVFEKMPVTGGNTRLSDGGLAAPGNHLQRRQGIADSPERFAADILAAGLGLNHPELVAVLAAGAAGAIAWTRTHLGVAYLDRLDRFGGHSVPRCLTTRGRSGRDLLKPLMDRLAGLEVPVRTGCRLTRLVRGPGGRVAGVEVQAGGRFPDAAGRSVLRVRARRGVVLATGGYAADVPFRRLQAPRLGEALATTNQRGATAEGLMAALAIGAAPLHLSWIQLGPWGCADEAGYGRGARFAAYAVYPRGIVVDPATGRRIVNEWADRRVRAEALLAAGHPCLGVVDARGAGADPESLAHGLKRGTIRVFEALEDLAAAWSVPAGPLAATAAAYNRSIAEAAPDPFGKPLHQGACPLTQPPYYAIRLWPKVHYTPGGVGIDRQARVIDLYSRPIPGLYAAGEVCGGIHGAGRLGCCALTEALVFGRLAGRQAAGPRKP
jgi:flavocytochrome c